MVSFNNYSNFFNNSIFLFSLLSNIFYAFSLNLKEVNFFGTIAKTISRLTTLSIFFFLFSRWTQYGYFPLSNLYESILFLSCILLFGYQVLEFQTQSSLFGIVVLPIVLFLISFGELTLPLEMQKSSALVPALQSNWLMMHVSLMMLSYAILLIGSLLSIVYIGSWLLLDYYIKTTPKRYQGFQNHIIKSINKKRNINLTNNQFSELCIIIAGQSPLNVNIKVMHMEEERILIDTNTKLLSFLDNWSYRAISLGFPFLTIGIIAGAVWANEAWGSYWSWDPKETWALITWLIFAAYLHLRLIVGWKGQNPAILASIGFIVVWICYLGVNFLGQGLHSYGWFT
uniref:cytochrome c biogenesis protein n=1 Tax=Ascoseira mirabilis TaxID=76830 RepID=UPI003001C74C|nr:cytochrome c biogenesis protein [Ascoseira mirabilis]